MSFNFENFQWWPAQTQVLAVTSASGRLLVPPANYPATTQSIWVRAVCDGSALVFIEQGDVTVVATLTTSVPVIPGEAFYFRLWKGSYLAAICAGTASLYLTPGYL